MHALTTPSVPPAPASWRDLGLVLAAVVGWRAIVTLVGFLSVALAAPGSIVRGDGNFAMRDGGVAWLACDSVYFHDIIANGYPGPGDPRPRNIVFFPGYPIAVRALTPLMSVENAMRVLPAITAVLGTLVVFAWAHRAAGRRVAWLTTLLVGASTGATFLSAGLSDSLFFCCAAAVFYCAIRRWFWLAALACAAAAATRPNGLAVAATLGCLVLVGPSYGTFARRLAMATVLGAVGYGTAVAYQASLAARFGDRQIYFKMQSTWLEDAAVDHTQRRAAEVEAIAARTPSKLERAWLFAESRLLKPGVWNRLFTYGLVALTLAGLASPPAGLSRAWFVAPLGFWLLAAIPDGGMRLNCLHRYMLAAPMLWLLVATWFTRLNRPALATLFVIATASVQLYYAWMFGRGVWCG